MVKKPTRRPSDESTNSLDKVYGILIDPNAPTVFPFEPEPSYSSINENPQTASAGSGGRTTCGCRCSWHLSLRLFCNESMNNRRKKMIIMVVGILLLIVVSVSTAMVVMSSSNVSPTNDPSMKPSESLSTSAAPSLSPNFTIPTTNPTTNPKTNQTINPTINPTTSPTANPTTTRPSTTPTLTPLNAPILYRITNADYTGWRPNVREFWMKDVNGVKIENAKLICSGSHTHEKRCQNAVDKIDLGWRPQCEKCQRAEAWIGFEVDKNVEVGSAYAKALGIGSGGGTTWNGGVILQKSDNGGKTWKDINSEFNSDLVKRSCSKPFVIVNPEAGKVVNLASGSCVDGTDINLATRDNVHGQIFCYDPTNKAIVNIYCNKVITMPDSPNLGGGLNSLILQPNNGLTSRGWTVSDQGIMGAVLKNIMITNEADSGIVFDFGENTLLGYRSHGGSNQRWDIEYV